MPIEIIKILTYLFLGISVIHFFVKNDEFGILLMVFFIATGILRYEAVLKGLSDWVQVDYAYNIFNLSDDLAHEALNLFFLGTIVFLLSYFALKNNTLQHQHPIDSQDLFVRFLVKKQLLIIGLFIFFIVLNTYFTKILSQYRGTGVAYGLSYFYLFKMAIGGLILLFFLIYKNIPLKNITFKFSYLSIILYAAYISYSPHERFQFLSWMVALGFIFSKNMLPTKKFWLYFASGLIVIIAFAYAGNLRKHKFQQTSFQTKIEESLHRLEKAEDQNMLDGFMMVLQVYPHYLNFSYGKEHFEILLRPIPRQLWPDKPVGGYVNKLKLNENMPGGMTIGISQSIYGTFYGEGGVAGIIILSILYGYIFAKLFQYSSKYNSDIKYLIKGIIFASAIPLLRGGDLPGIIAFIGMSYWPVFIFLLQYNSFIKRNTISKT